MTDNVTNQNADNGDQARGQHSRNQLTQQQTVALTKQLELWQSLGRLRKLDAAAAAAQASTLLYFPVTETNVRNLANTCGLSLYAPEPVVKDVTLESLSKQIEEATAGTRAQYAELLALLSKVYTATSPDEPVDHLDGRQPAEGAINDQ